MQCYCSMTSYFISLFLCLKTKNNGSTKNQIREHNTSTKLFTDRRSVEQLSSQISVRTKKSAKLVLPSLPVVGLAVRSLESLVQRNPHPLLHRSFFFPGKENIVYKLSHISGVRNHWIVHSTGSAIYDIIPVVAN